MTALETQPYSRAADTALGTAVDKMVTGARFTKRKSEAVLEHDEGPQKPSGLSAALPCSSSSASGSSTRRIGVDHGDKQRRFEHSRTIWTSPHVQGFIAKSTGSTADVTTSASGAGSLVAQTSLAVMDASIHQTFAEKRSYNLSSPADDATLETELDPLLVEEDALVQRIRELSSAHDMQRPELEERLDHTLKHEDRLRMARAEKKVDVRQHRPNAIVLPNEIVIQVLEYLHEDQSALLNVASVCLDWNLCATSILYRNPKFASTLHWALFIQTLCRSKESIRPRARRRPSLILNLSRSRQSSRHAPSQLAAAQIEVFGGRAQWNVSRLNYNLGEFVRQVDLSRKVAAVDAQCTCAKQLEAYSHQGGCLAHPETLTAGRVDSMHPANHIAVGTSQADQGTSLLVGDDASDTEADTLAHAVRTPMFSWRRDRFVSFDEPSSSTTTFSGIGTGDRWTHNTSAAGLTVRFDSANGANWSVMLPADGDSGGWRVHPSTHASHVSHSSGSRILAPSSSPLTPSTSMYTRPSPVGHFQTVGSPGHASTTRTRPETPTSHLSGPKSSSSGEFSAPERPIMVQRTETSDSRYKKPITITVSSLIQMAQYCSKLELLCLGSTILTPDTLFLETGDYQSTLQPGPRAGLTFVPVAVADVAKALGQYCPHLRKLWLPGCEWVTVDELRVFLTHCLQLEVLDLRHCGKLDGRLSQLFVLKNTGGVPQGGRNTEHSEGDDNNHDSNKEHRRASVVAMYRSGANRMSAPRHDVVERTLTSNHSMSAHPLERISPGPKNTCARKGAMFDVVNAASSGKLGTLSGADYPPWPQVKQQQQQQQHRQPSSVQEAQQTMTWEERLQLHFLQQQFLQQQQQQRQYQPEQQPLHLPPQMQLEQDALHAVNPISEHSAAYRYQLADDLCAFGLLQEQQQDQQRMYQQQNRTPQHGMNPAVAPDSVNRYQANDLCAFELLQSLDHPRSEGQAQYDTEHALDGQDGSSSHGCDSENSSATDDDDDNDDEDG
ncbi:hypothetical protein BGZ68_010241 [Mortierella alpina]|nr:hypothetical protein BGZ68_010241 [Mortierella alpina]